MENYLLYFILYLSVFVTINSHTHHLHNPHKERVEDGGRMARDHHHYDGENHNADFDHEAILGSAKEAEEFDDLPPEEAKKRLEVLVVKMDRNNDGYVDRRELHSWILRSFRTLSEEESEERLDEVDENEDGYVTWEEYIAETYGIKDPEDIKLLDKAEQDDERLLLQEDRDLFTAADVNLDGKLDAKEFLSFTHPEEDPKMLNILLQQTLQEKDTDKDGLISFQEFIGDKAYYEGLDELPFGSRQLSELVKKYQPVFMQADVDRSGYLDVKEVSVLADLPEEIAGEEVVHLFEQADDDSDDKLSLKEILDKHDVFVGSEATDFGDHLHNLERFEDEL